MVYRWPKNKTDLVTKTHNRQENSFIFLTVADLIDIRLEIHTQSLYLLAIDHVKELQAPCLRFLPMISKLLIERNQKYEHTMVD